MKNIKKFSYYILLPVMFVASFASCKKDQNGGIDGTVGGKGAPTISYIRTVSKTVVDSSAVTTVTTYNSSGVATTTTTPNYNPKVVGFDSTTVTGKSGNYYALIGTNLGSTTKIEINGVSILFNRALNSDNSVVFSIPATVPSIQPQSNKIVVTTLYGTVSYGFTVLQSAPQITSISPIAGSAGDTITIKGLVLDGATSVKFGLVAATATSAKIVSNTSTQLKVILPAGVVQAYVFVTTAGGTTKSTDQFGYKYLIYGDALTVGWGGNGGGYSGYNSTILFNNTTNVERGTNSIAVTFTDAYGAMQIGYGGTTAVNVATLGLKSLKFFVYGGTGIKTGDKLQVVVNGNYNGVTVTLTAGAYVGFTVPLSSLGNPTTITEVVLQGQGVVNPSTIYVDDLGFI